MAELPPRLREIACDIIVRIDALIIRASVADFKVGDRLITGIDQTMTVSQTGLEAGTHAGLQTDLSRLSLQDWCALKDIDEFVLLAMIVPQGRHRTGRKLRQVDAKISKPKNGAKGPLLPATHGRKKGLRIV